MQTRKLEIACPVCGSPQVFYTCTPNCCFNHVCEDCGTTFETATRASGGVLSGIVPPDPLPEAAGPGGHPGGHPTAACAKCESTEVYMTEDGSAVCGKCGALLVIELTEVTPG